MRPWPISAIPQALGPARPSSFFCASRKGEGGFVLDRGAAAQQRNQEASTSDTLRAGRCRPAWPRRPRSCLMSVMNPRKPCCCSSNEERKILIADSGSAATMRTPLRLMVVCSMATLGMCFVPTHLPNVALARQTQAAVANPPPLSRAAITLRSTHIKLGRTLEPHRSRLTIALLTRVV